jgi:competence protein ComEC
MEMYVPGGENMKTRNLFLSLILLLSIFAVMFNRSAASKDLYVHFINVGQGDLSFIHTAAGQNVLIDAGKSGAGTTVVNYLKKQHVTTLDELVATHPDADHIGGLAQVIKGFKVKSVYQLPFSSNEAILKG